MNILSDRLKNWIRTKAEKALDRFYEGPQPPERLIELVLAFVELYPNATRADWMRFAIEHGNECYRSGYQRGVEYVERAPETWRPDVPPEVVADMVDPDWRWRPYDGGIEYEQHEVPVTEEPNEVQRVIDEIKRTARKAWPTKG